MLSKWQKWAAGVGLAVLILGGGVVTFKARGIRNNNPGNLRITNIGWQGKVPRELNTDGEFEQFYNAEDGIRAMARDLRTGYLRGEVTPRQIITAWAPPVGQDSQGNRYTQNTDSYIASVVNKTGVAADDRIPPSRVDSLVRAIITHENGIQPYSDDVINRAIDRAGWGSV